MTNVIRRIEMEILKNEEMKKYYYEKYDISSYFGKDMYKYINLFEFKKNENVFMVNQEVNYFYFFVSGKVKIFTLNERGRSLLLKFNVPLQILGDLEFMEGSSIRTNVQTITESYLLGIDMDILRKECYDDPVFLKFIIKNLSRKLEFLSNLSSINVLYSVESRFAAYLLAIDTKEEEILNSIETNNLAEISEFLGTSYRHLLRIIRKLSDINVIEKKGKNIKIIDKEYLSSISRDIYK